MYNNNDIPPNFVYMPPAKIGQSVSTSQNIDSLKGNGTILFVDDEQILVDLTSTMLERLGYKTIGCSSACKALDIFSESPNEFNLVITDRTMSDMNGLTLLVKIKNIRENIPVVMCTGISDDISIEDLVVNGCSGLLSKPYSFSQLGETVKRVLTIKDNSTVTV